MPEHEWAVLVAFPVTLREAVAYEATGEIVANIPEGLLTREAEYGHVGCIRCSKSMHELGEAPCVQVDPE